MVHRPADRAATVVCLLALFVPQAVRAANFEFGPPTVSLSASQRIGTVTLTNLADAPIRFEVEAFGWEQRTDGTLQLDPTSDLVVFPQLLSLGAHETRRIRVAVSVAPAELEKTYRIRISEIPQFNGPQKQPGLTIELRSQLRLPVFFAPVVPRSAAAIADVSVRRGTLKFSLVNSGTTHFLTKNLLVSGYTGLNATNFTKKLDGWYVLAGGHRDYMVSLPHCQQLRAVTIDADAGAHVSHTIDLPADGCRP